ncbi:MAG: hypothetical protein JNM09_22725 [Blastocatellia bacterium]|nr:hypothetical protein [Blastocatellia bacterium]
MNVKQFEALILDQFKQVVEKIINDNPVLPISAKSRAGAEISDFLEDQFVNYTQNHPHFTGSQGSPKGHTKNPWDVKTIFDIGVHSEEIWVDFKALKRSAADSNPDIGTPDKIVNFILNGNFYLVYIHVYYEEDHTGLRFVSYNDSLTKLYFLKDISSTFRRNPKNQLQVNMSAPSEYRTRKEFIDLLFRKLKESHERQIGISMKRLKMLEQLQSKLLEINQEVEENLVDRIADHLNS